MSTKSSEQIPFVSHLEISDGGPHGKPDMEPSKVEKELERLRKGKVTGGVANYCTEAQKKS